MLGNNEKMNMNPSTKTTNEWPENNQIDEKGLIMASSSSSATTTTRVINMEKPTFQDQQQQLLKCPRCDSSNTKFCYYNNYSLSQPRHFCKACKRYWTRGGTLRNVPVGGSCRKNKRVRRPAAASSTEVTSISLATTKPNVQTGQVDLSSSSSSSAAAAAHMNPLFYSLLTNDPSDLNLQYPRFNSRVSNIESASGFEQINGIGLGFSSSGLLASHDHNGLLSSYNNNIPNVFGSTSTTSSTMASLLASSLHHQKLISEGFKDPNNFQNLGVYEDQVQVPRNAHVKMEDGQNRFDWNVHNNNNNQIHIDQISFSDANNSLLWNSNGGIGDWLDPSNIGSSVSSLI